MLERATLKCGTGEEEVNGVERDAYAKKKNVQTSMHSRSRKPSRDRAYLSSDSNHSAQNVDCRKQAVLAKVICGYRL